MSELYSYPTNDYRSYLSHHGVKGMRWGVRHEKERFTHQSRADQIKEREAKRKSRKMAAYGITSKQYDVVRDRSLKRHEKGTPFRNAYVGANAVLAGLRYWTNENNPRSAIGVVASAGLQAVISSAEWGIGRAIVDNITENSEFRRMSTDNALKKK